MRLFHSFISHFPAQNIRTQNQWFSKCISRALCSPSFWIDWVIIYAFCFEWVILLLDCKCSNKQESNLCVKNKEQRNRNEPTPSKTFWLPTSSFTQCFNWIVFVNVIYSLLNTSMKVRVKQTSTQTSNIIYIFDILITNQHCIQMR